MPDTDDIDDALDGLPTTLPKGVVGLPGAVTSASITSKINAAMAGMEKDAHGLDVGIGFTDDNGRKQIKFGVAVKISEGWAVYGDAAWDLHHRAGIEVGVRGRW